MTRRHRALHEDANQHLWAVSYSDLLMLLLAFFIVYFQMEDKESIETLTQVWNSLRQKKVVATLSPSAGSNSGTKGISVPSALNPVIRQVGSELEQNHIAFLANSKEQTILIHLADDIFGVGEFEATSKVKDELAPILEVLYRYRESIHLTIVGHADARPFSANKTGLVRSNFPLSNMRASRAIEVALQRGFLPENLSASGSAEFERASRSVSIVLSAVQQRPKKEEKP